MNGLENAIQTASASLVGAGSNPRVLLSTIEELVRFLKEKEDERLESLLQCHGTSRVVRRTGNAIYKQQCAKYDKWLAKRKRTIVSYEDKRRAAEAEGQKLAQEVEDAFEADMRAAFAEFGL